VLVRLITIPAEVAIEVRHLREGFGHDF
jgi:hypothetical protein